MNMTCRLLKIEYLKLIIKFPEAKLANNEPSGILADRLVDINNKY